MMPWRPLDCAVSPRVRSRSAASSSCRHEHPKESLAALTIPRGPRMTDVPRETSAAAGAREVSVSRETTASAVQLADPPLTAAAVFGDRLPAAREYARLLATDGVVRGLLGP